MTDMPDVGRQAGHVLVDMVSAFDPELGESTANGDAVNRAWQRLNEIEAVRATYDDETDAMRVDMTSVPGSAAVVVTWLVRQVALDAGVSREEVILALREFLDSPGE
jgi:hypothetical protein